MSTKREIEGNSLLKVRGSLTMIVPERCQGERVSIITKKGVNTYL